MWWKEAVVYQIYPRSFCDSNGDGIGDLKGIISKLDYLNGTPDSLGVDAIWLSPIYPSPMIDFGYDISDYNDIDPAFGDLKVFKELLSEAHKRNIKIIMDLVINHTSDKHPWFIESRSSKDNPKRDWYIWEDAKKGKPPNKWMAAFGGSAWEWDEKTEQYYYHHFTVEQPDLNWRNPEVKEAIFNMIRYWLDMGVDGFRLDVVNNYFKDDKLRDNPKSFFKGIRSYDKQHHVYDKDRPEMHPLLKEFRELLDSYPGDRMSVGEVFVEPPGNPRLTASYCGENDELHLAFNFAFLYSSWSKYGFKNVVVDAEEAFKDHAWPNYTLSNHDQIRHIKRYAKKGHTIQRAKIAAFMLLTLRGTPFLYYGEEIGMEDQKLPRKKIQDPVGKTYWPFYVGRDRARLPMCWDETEKAGFTTGEPWLPLNKNHRSINVKIQSEYDNSLFNVYKKLIEIRKKYNSLRKGSIKVIDRSWDDIFAYTREFENEKLLIVLNFKNNEYSFLPPADKLTNTTGTVIYSTHRAVDSSVDLKKITMSPYEGTIIKVDTNNGRN